MKGIYFTDIHFGRKDNSDIHNKDCIRFIELVATAVKNDPAIEYVTFLGDWHQSRTSLHQSTLHYSSLGMEILSNLGIPIFIVSGNHDMLYRESREIISTRVYRLYPNIVFIDEITPVLNGELLLVPFLTHTEYPTLKQYVKYPVWAGHFEFNGFSITGYGTPMEGGPSHHEYNKVKNILSGHFHKRQQSGNVTYIGNTFPMDYGDADDMDRGYAIYDHATHTVQFHNWEDCPKYKKISLTQLEKYDDIGTNTHLQCIIDAPMSYEDQVRLHEMFSENQHIREFSFQDTGDTKAALTDTEVDQEEGDEEESESTEKEHNEQYETSIDNQIVGMLKKIKADRIDNQLLISLYQSI